MTVDFSNLWNILGLLITVGSFIFYFARTLGKTVEQIERLHMAINTLQKNLDTQIDSCKGGRIELWTEVNKMRERVTKIETINEIAAAQSMKS